MSVFVWVFAYKKENVKLKDSLIYRRDTWSLVVISMIATLFLIVILIHIDNISIMKCMNANEVITFF